MTESHQDDTALGKNREFFADNDWYKETQQDLELYRFIAMAATNETRFARRLLDIGNGGVFIFPIDHIAEVEAIDVFVEEDFARRYPKVTWRQMSALDMEFERPFDTVIEINTLHHIVGRSVAETYENLRTVFRRIAASLEPGGRAVILESTVPRWFLFFYKLVYPALLKFWPLKHPPTFQFHFRELIDAAESAGLRTVEVAEIPKTSDLMTLGLRVKPWMSPISMFKFVFQKD